MPEDIAPGWAGDVQVFRGDGTAAFSPDEAGVPYRCRAPTIDGHRIRLSNSHSGNTARRTNTYLHRTNDTMSTLVDMNADGLGPLD